LHVDRGACAAHLGGRAVPLSPREVDLLFALAQSPNRALTRGQLLDRAWGLEADVDARVVDAYVTRLRKKLLDGWAGPQPPRWRIETVWGVGYKFSVEPGDR
jgi:two-component system response regulator ResD